MDGRFTSADRTREALRALAVAPPRRDRGSDGSDGHGDGTTPRSTPRATPGQRDLVAEAEAALATVEAAAAFAADGGFRRTRTVAETAADPTLARRARAVAETIDRYRAAYRASTADRGETEYSAAADRVRSAHDSHMPTANQPDGN